jgi:hypothetical protein
LKALLAAHPTPIPTLFGNTPRSASNAAGVTAVDKGYGPAKVIRLFYDEKTDLPVPPAVTNGRIRVGSCKRTTAATLSNALKYERLAYQHEIDAKIKKGQFTLAQWRSDMARFVALNHPGLSVILTADAFVNKSKNPADYLIDGVTHLGVDFDGISSSTGYHNYAKELAAVEAFTHTHGLTWGVAEFGANRAANDPQGTARAAWLATWGAQFAAAGAEYVCLWEADWLTGSEFTTPAEVAAARSLFMI